MQDELVHLASQSKPAMFSMDWEFGCTERETSAEHPSAMHLMDEPGTLLLNEAIILSSRLDRSNGGAEAQLVVWHQLFPYYILYYHQPLMIIMQWAYSVLVIVIVVVVAPSS